MSYTIIDSDNYAASGIETLFFPGGEPHVKVPDIKGDVLFVGRLRTWNDVGLAALVLTELFNQEVDHKSALGRFRSFIPYFPGARQDRRAGGSPMTVTTITDLLRTATIECHVFDIHSLAARRQSFTINHRWSQKLHRREWIPVFPEVAGIISPDTGAMDRAGVFRNAFYPDASMIVGSKVRDSRTGRLSNYAIQPLPTVGHYIIVDDICDGGGTFNLLMEAILKDDQIADGSTFELVVSHGIFSKGLDAIHPRIEQITTTDSWCQLPNSDRLTVVKLNQLYDDIMGEKDV